MFSVGLARLRLSISVYTSPCTLKLSEAFSFKVELANASTSSRQTAGYYLTANIPKCHPSPRWRAREPVAGSSVRCGSGK